MSEPSTAPYVATRLLDVPVGSDDGEGTFHLVRHHLGVRAFGVNGARADAGQLVITPHDERDDTDYGTEGHEGSSSCSPATPRSRSATMPSTRRPAPSCSSATLRSCAPPAPSSTAPRSSRSAPARVPPSPSPAGSRRWSTKA